MWGAIAWSSAKMSSAERALGVSFLLAHQSSSWSLPLPLPRRRRDLGHDDHGSQPPSGLDCWVHLASAWAAAETRAAQAPCTGGGAS
eukprot:8556423-Pyramimonas_sp.AAC.1